MKRSYFVVPFMLSGVLMGAAASHATDANLPIPAPPGPVEFIAPSTIVSKIHDMNETEIYVGNLALAHSMDSQVLVFARSLIVDHAAVDSRLQNLAQNQGLVVATSQPANSLEYQQMLDQRAAIERLKASYGVSFDREFLNFIVNSHSIAIDFSTRALDGLPTNGYFELRDYLNAFIPQAREHSSRALMLMRR